MNIALRKTLSEDIDYVYNLEQQHDNRAFIIPWPKDRHRAVLNDPGCLHLIIQGQDRIGFVILLGLRNPHRSIEFCRIVVQPKGQGVGKVAIRLIKRLAFKELGAHRLWLDVKTQNDRAKSLYLSEGFKEEGILRDCLWTSDRFESLLVMSMLESEFLDEGA